MRSDLKNSAVLNKGWADGEGAARAEAETI